MPSVDPPRWAVRRVGAADVGARVTLRRRLDGGGYADTVGVLLSYDAATAVVERAGGVRVEVAVDDVVASRVVG